MKKRWVQSPVEYLAFKRNPEWSKRAEVKKVCKTQDKHR